MECYESKERILPIVKAGHVFKLIVTKGLELQPSPGSGVPMIK